MAKIDFGGVVEEVVTREELRENSGRRTPSSTSTTA
jgi:hypothetical protein